MGETPISDGWESAKAWYQSKTIWGVLIALVSTAVKLLWPESGVDVEGAVGTVLEEGDTLAQAGESIWLTVTQFIGLAIAAWGRFKAHVAIK